MSWKQSPPGVARRALVLLSLAALVAAISAALWLRSSAYFGDELTRKRWLHRTLYTFGWTLPGTPDLPRFADRLAAAGHKLGAPVFIRIFKREHELELWLQRQGRFERFAVYPICRWSGGLGPKIITGDRQAPEGVYSISAASLNPDSRWHRAFNLGFPNPFDRAKGRTGSFLMVHGGCSSVGCYAMTNAAIDEIWQLVETALRQGQRRIQVQAFPFRPTDAALADVVNHPWAAFWHELRPAYDLFEAEQVPPVVHICHGSYKFSPATTVRDGSTPLLTSCKPEKAAAAAPTGESSLH